MMGGPCAQNHYLADHVQRLLQSLRHWTGKNLVRPELRLEDQARNYFTRRMSCYRMITALIPS